MYTYNNDSSNNNSNNTDTIKNNTSNTKHTVLMILIILKICLVPDWAALLELQSPRRALCDKGLRLANNNN